MKEKKAKVVVFMKKKFAIIQQLILHSEYGNDF